MQILSTVNTGDDTAWIDYGYIRGQNNKPIAVNDSYTIAENQTLTVTTPGVEANDYGGNTTSYTATLVSGSGPAHGTVTFNSNGSFVYVPTTGYLGTDSFQYKISDGDKTSNAATVTLNVVPPFAATAAATATYSGNDPVNGFLLPIGEANIDLNSGGVRLSQDLDFDQSPGNDVGLDPALVYNSASVTVVPQISGSVTELPGTAVTPTSIQAQLTWNGVPQGWVAVPVTGPAGGPYSFTLAVGSPVTSSGVYGWQVNVKVFLPGGAEYDTSTMGSTPVVASDNSPFGAGWGIAGIDRLVVSGSNVLWVTAGGDSRLFIGTSTLTGGIVYTSPPEDFGTLVKNTDGSFTYTAVNQTQYDFSAAGLLTSVVDPHGLTTTYAYDSMGRLTTVTAIDGGVTTLSYGTGSVTITEPGGRTVTLALDSHNNLTSITDADGGVRTLTYDTAHHVTSDQWSPWNSTFTYGSDGRVTGVALGTAPAYTILAAVDNGGAAQVTDPDGNLTTYGLDSRGRELSETDPGSLTQTWVRDSHGQVTSYTDQRGLTTTYTYVYGTYNSTLGGGDGDLVEMTNPDGSTETYAYDSTFNEVDKSVDEDGNVTTSVISTTNGDVLSTTDPLGTTTNTWGTGRRPGCC